MNLFRLLKLAFTSSIVKHLKPLVISSMTLWNLWTEPQYFQTVVLLFTQLHLYAIIFLFSDCTRLAARGSRTEHKLDGEFVEIVEKWQTQALKLSCNVYF